MTSSGPAVTSGRQRILLTTIGSLGDLFPYIAIARGLKARGHARVTGTSAFYCEGVEQYGIGFAPIRPDLLDPTTLSELMDALMDAKRGTEFVLRRMVLPAPHESYEDTLIAPDVALHAIGGTVMPGESEVDPERNSVQTLVAVKRDGTWQLAAFQNSRAQFLGRPDEAQALTAELRQLLEGDVQTGIVLNRRNVSAMAISVGRRSMLDAPKKPSTPFVWAST